MFNLKMVLNFITHNNNCKDWGETYQISRKIINCQLMLNAARNFQNATNVSVIQRFILFIPMHNKMCMGNARIEKILYLFILKQLHNPWRIAIYFIMKHSATSLIHSRLNEPTSVWRQFYEPITEPLFSKLRAASESSLYKLVGSANYLK
jgi:hypothetical protein